MFPLTPQPYRFGPNGNAYRSASLLRRGKGARVDKQVNIFLDIFGLAFLFFHALLCRWSYTRRKKPSLAYRIMIALIATYVLLDLVSWAIDGNVFPGSRGLYTAILLIYFAVIGCIPPLWLIFCDGRLQFNPKNKTRRTLLYLIFAELNLLSLIVHAAGVPIFRITEENTYIRGPLYPVHMVLSLGCIILSMALIFSRCKGLSPIQRQEYLALSMFLPPILIAFIIQVFYYGGSFLPICLSISAILSFLAEQEHLLRVDLMTGVRNRFSFEPQVSWLLTHVPYNHTLFCLMIDADKFKSINDRFGHSEGDRAVCSIANALLATCDRNDMICRFGGDEFMVVGQRFTEENVKQLVRDIHAAVQTTQAEEGLPYRLSVSIGVALFDPGFSGTPDELLRVADTDMYKKKAEKKALDRGEKPAQG